LRAGSLLKSGDAAELRQDAIRLAREYYL
jgi:hypothetical protein